MKWITKNNYMLSTKLYVRICNGVYGISQIDFEHWFEDNIGTFDHLQRNRYGTIFFQHFDIEIRRS